MMLRKRPSIVVTCRTYFDLKCAIFSCFFPCVNIVDWVCVLCIYIYIYIFFPSKVSFNPPTQSTIFTHGRNNWRWRTLDRNMYGTWLQCWNVVVYIYIYIYTYTYTKIICVYIRIYTHNFFLYSNFNYIKVCMYIYIYFYIIKLKNKLRYWECLGFAF